MSTKNPIAIVAFAGPAGSGKDTCGKYLIENYGARRVSFAGPIYDMLEAAGFGRPTTQEDKESIIPELGVSWRHMAQTLGTEWGRALVHANLWVISAEKLMRRDGGAIVITDLRFENEAATVRSMGGLVCHIEGRSDAMTDATATHASEVGIEFKDGDLKLQNDRTLEYLFGQLDSAAAMVGITRDTAWPQQAPVVVEPVVETPAELVAETPIA
jgi:hypothetical protein